jgi:crotonobetainyl-CoA:carnitine CoA-transferase CaiB-like acyl-CoA transferase
MTSTTPLRGIRVVEFTHMIMGPTVGMTLGDLGAEVVKVEPAPEGDTTRRLTGSGTGFYAAFGRSRRSLCVNMKTTEGMALVAAAHPARRRAGGELPAGRDGEAGPGLARSSPEINPGLVYCSCKGLPAGPLRAPHRARRGGADDGRPCLHDGAGGRPLRAGSSVIDIMGGLSAVIGILAALKERERTGAAARCRPACSRRWRC